MALPSHLGHPRTWPVVWHIGQTCGPCGGGGGDITAVYNLSRTRHPMQTTTCTTQSHARTCTPMVYSYIPFAFLCSCSLISWPRAFCDDTHCYAFRVFQWFRFPHEFVSV